MRRGDKPRRVLGYARVSSEEQAKGTSLDDQQRSIRTYAKAHGLKVARIYVEAESAIFEKIERREQIQALLADVRAGDIVLCDKLDRWSRDAEFSYGSIRRILQVGAKFYAVSDQCDPSTSDGDTMLSVRILVAREEHKRIRERTVGARKRLRDAGYYAEGQVPYGYRRQHPKGYRGADKNVLVLDPEKAKVAKAIFRLSIAGQSLSTIALRFGIQKDRVQDVIRSRHYLGQLQNSAGEWIDARHPAIVDESTWERANEALSNRRHGGPRPRSAPSRTDTWILRDVAVCGLCGSRAGAAYGPTQVYYYCVKKCGAPFVRVDCVEAEAAHMVASRLAELRNIIAKAKAVSRPSRDWATERDKLAKKRTRALDAFQDGFMTREELRARMARLDASMATLAADERSATKSALADPVARRRALSDAATMRKAWAKAKPAQRRAIVSHLAESVAVQRGASPVFSWYSVERLAVNEL